jgi:hypothetical protein
MLGYAGSAFAAGTVNGFLHAGQAPRLPAKLSLTLRGFPQLGQENLIGIGPGPSEEDRSQKATHPVLFERIPAKDAIHHFCLLYF